MNHTEVLVLNGSPGSGKTTLANAIGERLREIDTPHAVIDVDELARVHPEIGSSLGWKNLRAIWPNYTALPNLKVILPVCIDTKRDLDELRNAVPPSKFRICELVADELVLKERVTKREPNEYWQSKLRSLVEKYVGKDSTTYKFADFRVRTDDKSIGEATEEILNHLGWYPVDPYPSTVDLRQDPRPVACERTRDTLPCVRPDRFTLEGDLLDPQFIRKLL